MDIWDTNLCNLFLGAYREGNVDKPVTESKDEENEDSVFQKG